MDSIAGCVIPVLILTVVEIYSKVKGIECSGYNEMAKYIDKDANKEPSAKAKAANKAFSFMAINCFCATIGAIAIMLLALLIFKDPKTCSVSGIVIGFIISIFVIIAIYVLYRLIDAKKAKN